MAGTGYFDWMYYTSVRSSFEQLGADVIYMHLMGTGTCRAGRSGA